MTLAEADKQPDEMLDIVALARHQMSSAHIHPLERGQKMSELPFELIEYLFQIVARRPAQSMEMKPFYPLREAVFKRTGSYAEA